MMAKNNIDTFLGTNCCDYRTYNWPLNSMGLNCVGPFIHGFFLINIQSALHVCVFEIHIFNQPWIQTVYVIHTLESAEAEAICTHCSMPFYIRDLNQILVSTGALELLLCGYPWRAVKFGGSPKSYMDLWLHTVSPPLMPMLFKGPLDLIGKHTTGFERYSLCFNWEIYRIVQK